MKFEEFFHALWGFEPFPWQTALADNLERERRWPTPLGLPTAAGKTVVIDLAVFALAMGWPCAARRIFFVVDRRVVVDEAGQRARKIAELLRDPKGRNDAAAETVLDDVRRRLIDIGGDPDCPLVTSTLRGGLLLDDAWARTPIQPVVCCSTVDQVGSRLLFRGYGCSPGARPIHAGLLAYDSLVILDEVHLSNPFAETLDLIASPDRENRYLSWSDKPLPRPLQRIELSATPGKQTAFTHSDADVRHKHLGPRVTRSKWAALKQCGCKELVREIVASAMDLAEGSPKVVGVIVNRVSTARDVFSELQRKAPKAEHLLLTGRIRPLDRDRLWEHWRPSIEATQDRAAPDKTIYVVATQCVEAGANIDFDVLVTEAASLDALRQRFGRLNRLGNHPEANAVILAADREIDLLKEDGADQEAKAPHPVYGSALARTWKWLSDPKSAKGEALKIDFAHETLSKRLPVGGELTPLLAPAKHAAILLPAHLDALCQTQPEPLPSPDVSVFLHGPDSDPPDVNFVWREALDHVASDDGTAWLAAVAACRPSSLEMLPLPFHVARRWLQGETPETGADVEGASSAEPQGNGPTSSKARFPVLRWRGDEQSELVTEFSEVRPGDTIILPASRGGCDEFGWNPESTDPVRDLSETASLRARGRPLVFLVSRSHIPEVASLVACLDAGEPDPEGIEVALGRFSSVADFPAAVKCALSIFAGKPKGFDVLRLPGSGKVLALRAKRRALTRAPIEERESSLLPDDLANEADEPVELDSHQGGVAHLAELFAEKAGLADLVPTLRAGGDFHDIGKADPRFQAWLRGGNKLAAAAGPLFAKGSRLDRTAREKAREMSGYPRGARHEFMSVALLQANPPPEATDLFLHLVAAHHGHARALTPMLHDPEPITVRFARNGWSAEAPSDHKLGSLGSGVCERFWSLTRAYGWWGLAYLETLLRLADHRQSETEQKSA